ncbi:MAG: DUF1254 domain-containing protein [Acidobacteriaceae bacterium]|nr:DUF1254 domain-containing protein [Acidobacteriaceae bacterium]
MMLAFACPAADEPDYSDLDGVLDIAASQLPADLEPSTAQTYLDGIAAYIYGYPLVAIAMTERVATNVPNAIKFTGRSPINQLYKATQLPVGSTYKDVVLPSTTTMYAPAFLDLTDGPLILHISPISSDRYFIFQLLDAWTNVSRDSPSSRIGTTSGDYALVGPNNTQSLPSGLAGEIDFDTNTAWMITRVYTTGTQDDQKFVADQIINNFSLTPLTVYPNPYMPPDNIPVNPSFDMRTQPIKQVDSMDACAFFETMSAMMTTNPTRAIDVGITKRITRLGIIPGQFSCAARAMDTNGRAEIAALERAVLTAKQIMANQTPGETTTHWSVSLDVGDYGTRYLLRAVVAQQALGANRAKDAVYGYTRKDGTGTQLNGANNYTIHFKPSTAQHAAEEIPPVDGNGFWSLTLYQANGTLNDNKGGENWHALSTMYVEGHKACENADKSLDIFVGSKAPSDPMQYCNWLEAPAPSSDNSGDFILFLRLYWPDRAVTNKVNPWIPPAVAPLH